MPTITTVAPMWETNVEVPADAMRRGDSTAFLGDGSNNGVRGGIAYHGPSSLAVSINGSDQVSVQSGSAVIKGATGLGVYRVSLSATTAAVAIDPRNATNPRIDLVVFRSTGAVDIITGTPGASPSAPAVPSGSVELARLNIPAVGGGAAVVDSSFRIYVTGLGGTLYVEKASRLPTSGLVPRQRAIVLETGTDYVWTGIEWRLAGNFDQMVSQAGSSTSSGTGISSGVRLYAQGGTVVGTTNASGDLLLTYPSPFPTGLLAIIPSAGDPAGSLRTVAALDGLKGVTSTSVRCFDAAGSALVSTAVRVDYIALGW